ncbi:RND family transporter [Paraglaciecola sp. MB-3u-78]|uniref:efflux RND transporter permease subunit n=1 Tax=Paraglaciecola sp. MB-3u-78 TaxID=2058332 RepID=UPI000C33D8FF|nr:MMPL family transporter [Paraglaciecola sp. MB-3u-78]PKG97113.1 RND transporter [Paraglaciecola sp. MB-3u-78]
MNNSWLDFSVNRPKTVLIIGFMLIIATALGAKNLYFRGDYKVFFEDSNPQRMAFEEMQRTFSKNDSASIIIAPKSGNVFTLQTLSLIHEMTEDAEQTPLSIRIDSLTNFQHTWAEDDDMIVEDLVYDLADLDQKRLAYIQKVALNEPNLLNRLISAKADVTVINVSVNLPDGDLTAEVKKITESIKALTDKYKAKYPEHDFYHTGDVLMNYSFASFAERDFTTIVPLMFLSIILIMWLLLKTAVGTFSTVVVIASSIAVTMGIAGWFGMFMSTATVNVPTMVMTLAVADCIHVISTMLYGMRLGKDKKAALVYSLSLNKAPIFITSATTSVGFLTLNFAAVPILADLGNLTAVGVIFACIFSLTILPALIMVLPMKQLPKQISSTKLGYIERLGEWVITHHKRILPLTLVVAVIAIGFSFKNQLNDVPTAYFDKTTEFRQSTDFQQKHLSGMINLDFSIFTDEDSGINKPQTLQKIEAFSQWLNIQPEIDHVSSITNTFKRLNKNMHGDNPDYYQLPDDRELAAQYLLLYEMSLPYGLDLTNQLDMNKSATRVTAMVKNSGSKALTALEIKAQQWFSSNAPNLKLTVASPGLMFAHISEANMASMLKGTLVALVLISGLLVFALKSFKMGMISLLPNLLPAGIGFGIWGIYSGEVNLGLSVVLSMTLGIIVDDTVHFLSKYRHARISGNDAEQSVRYAFASVGRAIWITTLVLATGFSILMLSPFALNSDMGMLTSIIIVVALVVDFLFLPPFLMYFDRKNIKQEFTHE